jgi:hypothetical protein
MARLITHRICKLAESPPAIGLGCRYQMHVRRVGPLSFKRVAYKTQMWFLIRPMPALLGNPCINTKLASFLRLVKLDRVGR